MSTFLKPFRRLFNPIHPIPAGMYHYQAPVDDPRNYRLHLRLEEHGGGVLIVNASTVLHLNQTAAEYAYYLVHNTPADEVARRMAARYHVGQEQARQDYLDLSGRIQQLIETPDLDPVTFLDFERQPVFSGRVTAPYRLDCALTYRLPSDEAPDAAPIERVARELSTKEWKTVLEKAWRAGIPDVIFTGGEATLRDDLAELVAHTQYIGQVCGLLTDGLLLADEIYLGKLLKTGLDHLMIVLQPDNEQSWQAVANSISEDLFVTVHLTITPENQAQAAAYLERLAGLGVEQVSLSASEPSQGPALQAGREKATALRLDLIWNLPVPYAANHPVALEMAAQGQEASPEGAGRAWCYVEPDGDVRPAQGAPQVWGNLLTGTWEQIWRG